MHLVLHLSESDRCETNRTFGTQQLKSFRQAVVEALHVEVCVGMVADVSETRPELFDSFTPGLLLCEDFFLAGVGRQGAAVCKATQWPYGGVLQTPPSEGSGCSGPCNLQFS